MLRTLMTLNSNEPDIRKNDDAKLAIIDEPEGGPQHGAEKLSARFRQSAEERASPRAGWIACDRPGRRHEASTLTKAASGKRICFPRRSAPQRGSRAVHRLIESGGIPRPSGL